MVRREDIWDEEKRKFIIKLKNRYKDIEISDDNIDSFISGENIKIKNYVKNRVNIMIENVGSIYFECPSGHIFKSKIGLQKTCPVCKTTFSVFPERERSRIAFAPRSKIPAIHNFYTLIKHGKYNMVF